MSKSLTDSEVLEIENESNDQVIQSEESVLSPSNRKKMRIVKILESYVKDPSLPLKVLIEQGFCSFMLRHDITKEDICDLLLSSDVELNITSCNTQALMPNGIQNEEQQNALDQLALSFTELRCGHRDSSLEAKECVKSLVQNGNPSCYFVATKNKPFLKELLKLPGVAVISAKSGGNLILKEASSQKNFSEENTNESKKRKIEAEVVVESETEGVAGNRRLKAKAKSENELVLIDEPRCRTLFMGNLKLSINEQDIRQFFGRTARIIEVRISNRKNACFAHVEFATADDVEEAMKLNGKDLRGQAVNLDYAKKKPFVLDLARSKFSGSSKNDTRGSSAARGPKPSL